MEHSASSIKFANFIEKLAKSSKTVCQGHLRGRTMRQLEQGRARSAAGAEGWNYYLVSLKNTGMRIKFF